MNNVFIVVLSDYRLSGLIRVSINTGMDQVAVDKTLFLSQRKSEGGYLRFIQEKTRNRLLEKKDAKAQQS